MTKMIILSRIAQVVIKKIYVKINKVNKTWSQNAETKINLKEFLYSPQTKKIYINIVQCNLEQILINVLGKCLF